MLNQPNLERLISMDGNRYSHLIPGFKVDVMAAVNPL